MTIKIPIRNTSDSPSSSFSANTEKEKVLCDHAYMCVSRTTHKHTSTQKVNVTCHQEQHLQWTSMSLQTHLKCTPSEQASKLPRAGPLLSRVGARHQPPIPREWKRLSGSTELPLPGAALCLTQQGPEEAVPWPRTDCTHLAEDTGEEKELPPSEVLHRPT